MQKKLGYVLALVMVCLPAAVSAQVMPEPKPVVACGERARQLWSDWVDAWSRDDAREAFPTLLPPEAHPEAFVPRS